MECRVVADLLATAPERAPGLPITNEEQYIADDDLRLLVWAEGGDFEAFERRCGR